MKVGILSMQRIRNYGSFLQAYALKKTIESLGHEVEFVDYKIEDCIVNNEEDKSQKKSFINRVINSVEWRYKYVCLLLKREKSLAANYDKYLELLGISDKYNYRSKVDTLVIGSDEVFNCLQNNKEVGYSKELFGANNNAKNVISYAASCGTTTMEGLKKYNISADIGDMLSKFKAISVRDSNTAKVVQELTNIKPVYNLDPVFIYDFDNVVSEKLKYSNYIVVYAYENRITREEAKEIRRFANKYNKKLICIGNYQKCCDIYIKASPFELLSYMKNADYIITDTFHGSVFSIKYNKKFAAIVRENNAQKLNDLLSRFSLDDRKVRNIKNLEEIIVKPIDYSNINKFIEEQKECAIKYFDNNI